MKKWVTFGIVFLPKSNKATNGKAPLQKQNQRQQYGKSAGKRSLDLIYNKLYECSRQLNDANFILSAQVVKARNLGEDDFFKKLSELLNYHTEHMKQVLKYGAKKNYCTTQRYLYKFLKLYFKVDDIFLKQINYQFITDFEHFLRNYKPKRDRKAPTKKRVMKHLEWLKKLLNLAQKLEWVEKDPFAKLSS